MMKTLLVPIDFSHVSKQVVAQAAALARALRGRTVHIWDRGTYEVREWTHDKIVFRLHGSRLEGDYVLIRFPRSGNIHWLWLRMHEGAAF